MINILKKIFGEKKKEEWNGICEKHNIKMTFATHWGDSSIYHCSECSRKGVVWIR